MFRKKGTSLSVRAKAFFSRLKPARALSSLSLSKRSGNTKVTQTEVSTNPNISTSATTTATASGNNKKIGENGETSRKDGTSTLVVATAAAATTNQTISTSVPDVPQAPPTASSTTSSEISESTTSSTISSSVATTPDTTTTTAQRTTTTTTPTSPTNANNLTATPTNGTLISKSRKPHPQYSKLKAFDILPPGIFISHISPKPGDRHTKVFHVDPTSFPKLPLRTRRSVTNFQYSRLISDKEAETECRALREIKGTDEDRYRELGFQLTGDYIIVDSRFHGEVARTTVGWIRVERNWEYWQYLSRTDEGMVEIMRYSIWSPGAEICKSFLREEEVMCCRRMKETIRD